MRSAKWLLVAAMAVGTSACAGTARPNTYAASEEGAVVLFSNGATEQAAVYATSGGEIRRIGTVLTGQLAKLKIPATMVARGSVNIFARLLARNEQPQSGAIMVAPGTTYEITLMPDRRTMMVLPSVSNREH